MADERDPQAHRIMELRRELDELRATIARVRALDCSQTLNGQRYVYRDDLDRALDGDR